MSGCVEFLKVILLSCIAWLTSLLAIMIVKVLLGNMSRH